jgi:hypothetical protein
MKNIMGILMVVVVLAGITVYFVFMRPEAAKYTFDPESPEAEANLPELAPQGFTVVYPKPDTLIIGTSKGDVEVRNFYKNVIDTEEGMVILKDGDYTLTYDRPTSKFSIIFRQDPAPDTLRTEAQQALLDMLGVGEDKVCMLDIDIVSAYGEVHKLCEEPGFVNNPGFITFPASTTEQGE